MDNRELNPQWMEFISDIDGYGFIKLKENQSYMIIGRSGSGKSTFIYKFLTNVNQMVDSHKKTVILYCYKSDQPLFHQMKRNIPNIIFHQGIMSQDDIIHKYSSPGNTHLIIVVDDLMREVVDNADMCDFFTVRCHHSGCSMIYVSHNLFQQGKYSKTLAVNAGYVILFETPAGIEQIQTFGRQRFPCEKNMLVEAYRRAILERPYGYLLVDMTVNIPREFRIRSDIFPQEKTIFYI